MTDAANIKSFAQEFVEARDASIKDPLCQLQTRSETTAKFGMLAMTKSPLLAEALIEAVEALEKYRDIAYQYRPEGTVFAARDTLARIAERIK